MALPFSFFFFLFVFVCLNVSGELGSLPALLLMPLWQAEVHGVLFASESLFVCLLRGGGWKGSGRRGCAGPLTPWRLPGDLLWLGSSSGLCSTSQRASRLGRRRHGRGGGQGSAAMPQYPCPRGVQGGTVPGRGSRLLQVQ